MTSFEPIGLFLVYFGVALVFQAIFTWAVPLMDGGLRLTGERDARASAAGGTALAAAASRIMKILSRPR